MNEQSSLNQESSAPAGERREGALEARLVEEVRRSLPLAEEILRLYEANRFALLPLEDLAARLIRDPELVRATVARLVELGFLGIEGAGASIVLTRDRVKLREIEALLAVLASLQNPRNPS